MRNKTIYHIQLSLVWLGVIAGFAGIMIQLFSESGTLAVVGALGGFFWPLTCLLLVVSNHRLAGRKDEA